MIYNVVDLTDPYALYLKDDPVRPHIPHESRFGENKAVLALVKDERVTAMVCSKFTDRVPATEQELIENTSSTPTIAVFYTIWSYDAGAGRQLILEALRYVKANLPTVTRFITLSPPTEMARKFHLKNGANVFRVNEDSVNYEYIQ